MMLISVGLAIKEVNRSTTVYLAQSANYRWPTTASRNVIFSFRQSGCSRLLATCTYRADSFYRYFRRREMSFEDLWREMVFVDPVKD